VLKQDIAIAPVFHRLPERIKAHALICFLALLLHRLMRPRLKDLSPTAALEKLKGLQRHHVKLGDTQMTGLTATNDDIKSILRQLELPLPTDAAVT
jgi:transposase